MSSAQLLERLRRSHGQRHGLDLLAAMVKEFPGRLGIISSFGIESAVLLDLVAQIDPSLPVIFLDSGELFDETHAYRRLLTEMLGLRDVRCVRPDPQSLAGAEELWRSDPDRCCALRKVEPLHNIASGFDILVDGRKRIHGADRSQLQTIEAGDRDVIKLSPLARWSEADIAEHFRRRGLPLHPLAGQGYLSVGCWPCSRPAQAGEGPRAGRWSGSAKTECGIHLPAEKVAAE